MTGTGWSVTIVRAVSQSQILTRPRRIAYRTMPAMFGVSSFLKMCARWDSAVLTLIPRASATSFVVLPSATSYRTSRSRGVSGSGGSSDFARYAWTSVRETRGLRYIMPLSTSWALRRPAWHHVAIVSDGSTLRVLVDGAPSGTPQVVSLGAVIGTLQAGAWTMGSANYDFFGGRIDEVRVYSRALAQTEVQTDMNTPIAP